jgi:hypothetical protein
MAESFVSITNLNMPVNRKLRLHFRIDWRYHTKKGADDEKNIWFIFYSVFYRGFLECGDGGRKDCSVEHSRVLLLRLQIQDRVCPERH